MPQRLRENQEETAAITVQVNNVVAGKRVEFEKVPERLLRLFCSDATAYEELDRAITSGAIKEEAVIESRISKLRLSVFRAEAKKLFIPQNRRQERIPSGYRQKKPHYDEEQPGYTTEPAMADYLASILPAKFLRLDGVKEVIPLVAQLAIENEWHMPKQYNVGLRYPVIRSSVVAAAVLLLAEAKRTGSSHVPFAVVRKYTTSVISPIDLVRAFEKTGTFTYDRGGSGASYRMFIRLSSEAGTTEAQT